MLSSYHFVSQNKSRGQWFAGVVTVLKEFCQGPNAMMYVLPTGGYDPNRHKDFLSCAKSELLEEVLIIRAVPSCQSAAAER